MPLTYVEPARFFLLLHGIDQATLANFRAIQMRPESGFASYLVEVVGFSPAVETLKVDVRPEHQGKGFDRPVLVFTKPDPDDEDEDEDDEAED